MTNVYYQYQYIEAILDKCPLQKAEDGSSSEENDQMKNYYDIRAQVGGCKRGHLV